MTAKKIIIIAGPNGAGKTTFGQEYLPNEADCPIFVNADLIAAGLSPFRPADAAIRAGRLMLEEIDNHARAGRNFAIETTLSGRGYVRRIRQWRADGYTVKLIFLSLATPEEAITRVKSRINQGGHDVPEAVIRRRFHAGLWNFQNIYRHCVDDWFGYNNSDTMLTQKELPKSDNDEEGVTAALIRATKRAHKIAHQTGTKVVVMRDSKVVEIDPNPEMYNDI